MIALEGVRVGQSDSFAVQATLNPCPGAPSTGTDTRLAWRTLLGVCWLAFTTVTGWSDDHGDSMGSATFLSVGGSVGGTIEYAGDQDYFRLEISSSGTLTAYTTGSTDTYGHLLNASGTELAYNDDNPYPNFNFSASVSAGTYYLRVHHWSSGGTGGYTLHTSFSGGGGGGGGGGGPVPLGEALDNASLSWTTGGNSSWSGQTGNSTSGGDAAQAGWLDHNQSNYLETTVSGPGTLSFYWSVSSEGGCDFVRFFIDGLQQTQMAGESGWQYLSYNLSSGTHTLRWTYSTDGSVFAGSHTAWVDGVQFTPSAPPPPPSGSTPDIIWRHRGVGLNAVWFMNGASLQQSSPILPDIVPDLDWNIVGVGDFNQDGQKDLVWQHRSLGDIGIWFMNGRGMQSAAMANPVRASDLGWKIVGVADFNQDAKPDLLWQHDSTRQIAIWYMDGVIGTDFVLTNPPAPNDLGWQIMGTGDFDRNGTTDIVWQHVYWDYIAIWYMNGTSFVNNAYTTPYISPNDVNWDIVDTGDFNADGTADFLWQHQTTGATWIWYLNNNYVNGWPSSNLYPDSVDWRAQAVGQIRDDPVDTDNDLMTDSWEIQYFGNLAHAASGDYDGDGVNNLTEFRTGTNPVQPNTTIKISRPRNWSNIP